MFAQIRKPSFSVSLRQLPLITLIIGLLTLFLSPSFFHQTSANLAFLISFFIGILICLYFLYFAFKSQSIPFTSSKLFWPLILLGASFFFVSLTKTSSPSLFLLNLGGLFINFALLSLLSATLVKNHNGLFIVKLALILASLSSLIMISYAFSLYYNFSSAFSQFINVDPLLHFSFITLGFVSLFSLFFKKGRFQPKRYSLLPLFVLGITAITFISASPNYSSSVISFSSTLDALYQSLFQNQHFHLQSFLTGQPHLSFADFYYNFSSHALNSWSDQSLSAFNTPLAIFSLFGIFPLLAWLGLFISTFICTFSQRTKENNYLFLILLVSFIIQCFTPPYPSILFFQALIIAFAVNKKVSHHCSFSFIKNSFSRRLFFSAFLFFLSLPLIWWSWRYLSTSISYFTLEKTLAQSNLDLDRFYSQSLRAQKLAPFNDEFNRFAAIASLEKMVSQINDYSQNSDLSQARILAQQSLSFIDQAVSLNPYRAVNYSTQGDIYSELVQYNADSTVLNDRALAAYTAAIFYQPYNPNLYLQLASFYQSNQQIDLALSLTQQALKLASNYLPTLYQLAQIYQSNDQKDFAIATYQQILPLLDRNSPNYQNNLTLINYQLQQLDN